MSKVKPTKSKGIPSKHLHARTTFLYQAAMYLTFQTFSNTLETSKTLERNEQPAQTPPKRLPEHSPLALQLGSDLQQVSRKAQLRLSVDLKRTMCKSCNTILVPGLTATQTIGNMSKGGKKPWADVLFLECRICGGKKKFPVGATKQLKKCNRKSHPKETTSVISPKDVPPSDTALQTGTEPESTTG